jgi:carbonic anhydrase
MSPHSFCRNVLFASILSLVGLLPFSSAQEVRPTHWAYSGPEGPLHWGVLDSSYTACSAGHTQSPIDITHSQLSELPSLKPNYKAVPLNIIDNGHTIQVNYANGSTLTVGDRTYSLKQFHFHHPSEEHVNGKGFPLAAHLLHADADGNLAVIAILFEQGNSNPLIENLWRSIPSEKEKAIDIPAMSVQAKDLLPKDLSYFTYTGSLTTPPCSEGVTWYVLINRVTVSPEQVAAFSKIYPMDSRPIQPTNGRGILRSK